MSAHKRVILTVKSALEGKEKAVATVLDVLKKSNVEVFIDMHRFEDVECTSGCKAAKTAKNVDAVVVIGGDGTILRAVREFRSLHVPFITVNRGRLGFMAELAMSDVPSLLPQLLSGKGVLETRSILGVSVERSGKSAFECTALNEAVISQGAISRLIELHAKVGDETLTTFHADGLIVSTPTGSTAYSLAAGGPIVHPHLAAMILTPINPHSFSQKPLVLPQHLPVEVSVHVRGKAINLEVGLSVDGQEYFHLKEKDVVHIKTLADDVQFLRTKKDTFLSTLRTKLKWGDGPETM